MVGSTSAWKTIRSYGTADEFLRKLPMARVWPPSQNILSFLAQEEDVDVQLPPVEVQDRLIALYFTYVHPVFPVIHKAHFMTEYNSKCAIISYTVISIHDAILCSL